MFEQSSYDKQTVPEETRPEDLFHNYEIRNWVFGPFLYKVLAISAILNLSALLFIGQTNLLTMRGCDSPFVGRVCQVLDMAYVGSVLFGTEREYADVAYEKTELADADITYIDLTGETPPLSYPQGYFQIANPVQYSMLKQAAENGTGFQNSTPNFIPGLTTTPNKDGDLLSKKATPPPSNPSAFTDDSTPEIVSRADDSMAGINRKRRGGGRIKGSTTPKANPNSNTNTNTVPSENTTAAANTKPKTDPTPAQQADEAKQDQFGIFINKRPLKDYAEDALEQIDDSKVKLDTPVKVVISGTLGFGSDGKTVVLKDPVPVKANGDPVNDPAMEKFVQDAILATGDAGWFGYLGKFGVKTVLITVEQTNDMLKVDVRSEQPNPAIAESTAKGIGGWITLGAGLAGGDEKKFLSLAKPHYNGNTFILNFDIPKPMVQEMVLRKLQESKENKEKEQNKPNSTAIAGPGRTNTAKR